METPGSGPPYTDGYLPEGARESLRLAALVDQAAILSVEQQEHISRLHGEDHWGVDAGEQTFTFTAADGRALVARAHLLGSAAPGPMSWLWGWVNANGFPPAFFALSETVRQRGETEDVPELVAEEVPLTEGVPLRLTIAAKAITGLPAHYSAPTGGGTRVWVLIEHPDLVLPAPTVLRTMEAIQATLSSVQLTDPRTAVREWARSRGATVTDVPAPQDRGPNAESHRVAVSDGEVFITYDALHRIVQVRAQVGPQAVAEPAPSDPAPPERPHGVLGRLFGRRAD